MRDVQSWLGYRKEMQRALRGAGVVQRRGDHFGSEGLGRKLLSQSWLAWLILSFWEITTDKALGKAKEKIPRARDSLVHCDTKKSDLKQGFLNLIVHTNYVCGGGRGVFLKNRFWFSRSRLAWDPACLVSPQVMAMLPVRTLSSMDLINPCYIQGLVMHNKVLLPWQYCWLPIQYSFPFIDKSPSFAWQGNYHCSLSAIVGVGMVQFWQKKCR